MKLPMTPTLLAWILLAGCSPDAQAPPGPIAGSGTAPLIDGVFDEGEWDDAAVVRDGARELFRVKHDGTNVYFAVRAGGGELAFDMDGGLRVLHWSGQLGSLAYAKTGTATQSLARPFDYELWGLRDEPPAVVRETLAAYLARNGWTANLASMGNLMESELAVSLDWLGMDAASGRLAELPGLRVEAGLMVARNDPLSEAIRALSREELDRRYPAVYWPTAPAGAPGRGGWPDTLRVDPARFGRIRIDLRDGTP